MGWVTLQQRESKINTMAIKFLIIPRTIKCDGLRNTLIRKIITRPDHDYARQHTTELVWPYNHNETRCGKSDRNRKLKKSKKAGLERYDWR